MRPRCIASIKQAGAGPNRFRPAPLGHALDTGLDPPAVENAQVERAVERRLHAARAGGLHRRHRSIEPHVAPGDQRLRHLHVVVGRRPHVRLTHRLVGASGIIAAGSRLTGGGTPGMRRRQSQGRRGKSRGKTPVERCASPPLRRARSSRRPLQKWRRATGPAASDAATASRRASLPAQPRLACGRAGQGPTAR